MFRRGVRSTAVGILLSAAALALNSVGAMAATSWVPENQHPNLADLHGVFAIDGCHVWAVGEEIAGRSQITHTADGGATWTTVFPPPNSGISTTLNRVAFADANTGYIVGENDEGSTALPGPNILKTIDGGVTWTDLRPNLPANDTKQNQWWSSDFEGLAVVGNDVWLAWSGNDNQKGEILHSSNGGGSWDIKLPVSGSNVGMAGVSFADANHGWAIRDNGQVYQTSNGGANWNQIDDLYWSLGGATLEQVAAIDATHVVVVADNGTAWYLDGIGANRDFDQSAVPASASGGLNDVSFNSAGVGYAVGVGTGTAYKSTDGGQNFVGESLNNGNKDFGGVSIAAGTTFAWAVGDSGHISANTAPATACPTPAIPTTTTTTTVPVVIPKLPSAGHPLMPADYNWILLLLIPAIGMLGWLSVKPD